jgi:hypothetical protein
VFCVVGLGPAKVVSDTPGAVAEVVQYQTSPNGRERCCADARPAALIPAGRDRMSPAPVERRPSGFPFNKRSSKCVP